MADYKDLHIESTLPKPWEEEHSFNDTLYEWMSSAPWLAISAAAHLLVYFILAAIPWRYFQDDSAKEITAKVQPPPEEPFEEPEEEPEEELEEVEPIEEPVLKDAEISDHNETDDDQPFEESEGDPDFNSDSPFDSDQFNNVLGIGGGAGGKFGNRRGGRRNLKAGKGIEEALRDGLEWLKNHQSPDGYWDCDGFSRNAVKCNGDCGHNSEGHAQHDVGVTGLALLAFLGEGNTTTEGQYKEVVANGIKWLREQQDLDSGLIGEKSSHEFLYNHSLAALALCEAYYGNKSPLLKRNAQAAINYIQRARNPYGAWRYDVPPIGDNDSSVTGWMVFALAAAKDAELDVDMGAFDGALSWIDEVTDPQSGRVGYDSFGSLSSRTVVNEHFPREKGEAMTSVGLLCRIFIANVKGENIEDMDILDRHAELLKRTPPLWDEEGFGCDMYYWYYGTYAMFQMGGQHWRAWEGAMKDAVINPQRKDGDFKGSWDPVGPWGYAGGRVYSTAIMTLCAEVYFRYPNVLGAR
jgi:hypothetical protein